MSLDVSRAGELAVVTLRGTLAASGAGEVRAALLEALADARRIEVRLRDVEEADLTLLQLLCAAQRTAAARGVEFVLSGAATPGPVRGLVEAAGAGSCAACAGGCAWARRPGAPEGSGS